MKETLLLIFTVTFFIACNTKYFWEGEVGVWGMLITFLLLLAFIFIALVLLRHIYLALVEKNISKSRLLLISVISIVVGLTLYKPFGLIDFDQLAGKNLLIAHRESVASCSTTLKLKDNGNFVERVVCFKVEKTHGQYKLENDTIWFMDISEEADFYQFGVVIEVANNKEELVLYKNEDEKLPHRLFITKNDLQHY